MNILEKGGQLTSCNSYESHIDDSIRARRRLEFKCSCDTDVVVDFFGTKVITGLIKGGKGQSRRRISQAGAEIRKGLKTLDVGLLTEE
jgi:hypothetical protein